MHERNYYNIYLLLTKCHTIFLCFPGNIIIFEIFSTDIFRQSQLMLKNISKLFINPLNRNMYKLLGIVAYKNPLLTRNVHTIGHYTAICFKAK